MISAIDDAQRALRQGRPAEALAVLEAHLARTPDDPAALGEMARVAMLAGDLRRAHAALGRALELAPEDAALLARAAALQELGGAGESAIALARRALTIDPGELLAAALLTRLLTDRCLPGEAIDIARAALAERDGPETAQLQRALASALLFQGRAAEALATARAASTGRPGDPAAVGTTLAASLYDDSLGPAARAELHRELGRTIPPVRCAAPLAPLRRERLRVGFYSADFRNHPVGHLIRPILEQLDRERFEACGYAHLEQRDAMTDELAALPRTWRDVTALSDVEVLECMRADRLDVLIDLAGHSHGGRPRVLRGRAAPVQLSWLGYLNTSGLPEMDGLIGDDEVFPQGCEPLYTERVWRLPLGLFCLQMPDGLPPVAPLPMRSRGHPVLGSFNHLAKLSDATVALWSRLLQARPDARLVLCSIPLLDERTREFTAARFVACGIDPDRIELRPPQPPGERFLRQYDEIDLALDPLPFSGGATTLDALRQGVPVVTRAGDGMHSRTSASLLHRIGLRDFVAEETSDYIDIANGWLSRPDELAALRAQLRGRLLASPAGDSERYARSFERMLLEIAAASRSSP